MSTKAEKTIEFWRKRLNSEDLPEVERAKAAHALGLLAPHSHVTLDDLISGLEEAELVRASCIQTLYVLRGAGVDVLGALREALIVNNRAHDKRKKGEPLTGLPQVSWLAERMGEGWTEGEMKNQPPPVSDTEPPKFEESQE